MKRYTPFWIIFHKPGKTKTKLRCSVKYNTASQEVSRSPIWDVLSYPLPWLVWSPSSQWDARWLTHSGVAHLSFLAVASAGL
jgi:hypothetical protein